MIRVLIADDEPVTLELHRTYTQRLPEFEVVGEAHGAHAAAAGVFEREADLVLLDMSMPDGTGLDVLRTIRGRGFTGGVIAITAVRDIETVRAAVALGVTAYLVKPFTWAEFAERMQQFARFRDQAHATESGPATQHEIDAVLGSLRVGVAQPLPKGLSVDTLDAVTNDLRNHGVASAADVADRIATSRVSARRYLEYLADAGLVHRQHRRGGHGRPTVEYCWSARA